MLHYNPILLIFPFSFSLFVILFSIEKVLCNHVLGHDKAPLSDIMDDYELGCSSGGIFSLIDLISDNNRPIDRFQIENALKLDPPILQGSETVELAFQGRRVSKLLALVRRDRQTVKI